MELTPEERQIGADNYHSAVTAYDQDSRRDFLKKTIAGGAAIAGGTGAMYFNYTSPRQPVRVCVIGTGDEGGVLIGALNPKYVEVVSICDIRPSSEHRAFHGDWSSPNAKKHRKGLMEVYGWDSEDEARKQVATFNDYKEAIDDPATQAVIIALPLHLHAPVAIYAMLKGKHVLCEKLMAHNIAQCKWMARTAEREKTYLAVGHQRHYSVLYDNAVKLLQWGLLGELHHIRAQWHRGNLPGNDSWAPPIPGVAIGLDGSPLSDDNGPINKIARMIASAKNERKKVGPTDLKQIRWWNQKILQYEKMAIDETVDAAKYGYLDQDINGRNRSALEELIRWRLWDRTGGGLMAELGSHQLDAASIFISAMKNKPGEKVHPLSVHAVGGRHTFPMDRDAEDHVYCMFEFPGPGYDFEFPVGYRDIVNSVPPPNGVPSYETDSNKKIVVTYSSINGNGYGGYGEVVMGTRGTMILEKEKDVYLYQKSSTSMKAGVKANKKGTATLDTTESGDAAPAKAAAAAGEISRGYKEEIEHWAWCISEKDWSNQPRCNGKVALGDAVIALTSKIAIARSNQGYSGHIEFNPEWFDFKSDAVPEETPDKSSSAWMGEEKNNLGL